MQIDWTRAVDAALATVAGLSDREAGEKLDVSNTTVQRWRERRRTGADIGEPRGRPRNALLRFAHNSAREPEEQPSADLSKLLDLLKSELAVERDRAAAERDNAAAARLRAAAIERLSRRLVGEAAGPEAAPEAKRLAVVNGSTRKEG